VLHSGTSASLRFQIFNSSISLSLSLSLSLTSIFASISRSRSSKRLSLSAKDFAGSTKCRPPQKCRFASVARRKASPKRAETEILDGSRPSRGSEIPFSFLPRSIGVCIAFCIRSRGVSAEVPARTRIEPVRGRASRRPGKKSEWRKTRTREEEEKVRGKRRQKEWQPARSPFIFALSLFFSSRIPRRGI